MILQFLQTGKKIFFGPPGGGAWNTAQAWLKMSSGLDGPTIKVTNSESGYIFQGGLRFIPELGLFQDKGIFKPYTGVGIGFGHFNEITEFMKDENEYDNELNETKKDKLYSEALKLVKLERKASTRFFQRKLQIGYNRAARIIDMMEKDGIVSQANHVGKREIL